MENRYIFKYGKTYRDILADASFLNVRRNANQIGEVSIDKVYYNEKEVLFTCPSQYNNPSYHVRVQIVGWDRRKTKNMTPQQLNEVIANSDIKIWCSCPAYRYWGFKYINTVDGAAIHPENRFPEIRNPQLQGGGCKHTHRVLQIWAFNINKWRLYFE